MVSDNAILKLGAMLGITAMATAGVCFAHLDGVLIASAMSAVAGIVGYTIGESKGEQKAKAIKT